MKWTFFHRLSSPKWFYEISGRCLVWTGAAALACTLCGLLWGLLFAPPDYQQGNSYRIIFIHVPAASLALVVYLALAVMSAINFVWKIKLADMAAACLAPIGASFCSLALVTGAIWGKPTWGAWWVWDARLTSMLILLFLYCGLMALRSAFTSQDMASRACAILAMVGLVNIPVIKFSVEWWSTLHQGASLRIVGQSSMDPSMLKPLLVSLAGFYMFCLFVFLLRLRAEVVWREWRTSWVRALLERSAPHVL
ncbi:MAG: heme ABC transporter permease [Kistimonas sp.]|nr:heme ABC transporter permease [Kistimonas sp.]